ncbi:MAG: hypothetical protein ACLS8Q_10830 [Anaerovoracaceae bacterium]
MKRTCSLCGSTCYEAFAFKGGYVCENCLQYLKSECSQKLIYR